MMKVLNECGIPVAHPIPTVDGREYIEYHDNYYLLTNKLSGNHILNIYELDDYLNITYETGKIVAKLHTAFISCEQRVTFWDNSLLDEMKGWVCDIFKEHEYKYITRLDYIESLNELERNYNNLPRQLIHRDMYYGNILFDNGKFSGYIDFDLSQKNIRIFDLCYFLLGLIVDNERNEDNVKRWFEIISSFISGYETIIPLTKYEKMSICSVMKSIELLFAAYFLREKDEVLAKGAASIYYFV